MSKVKKGDWLLEDDAKPGNTVKDYGYRIHDVLPNGEYVVEVNEGQYSIWSETLINSCVVEPRCTGWDWVLPEPLIDGPGKYVNRSGKVVEVIRKVSSNIFPSHCWGDTQDMLYRPDGTYNVSDQPCPRDIVSKYVEPPKPATKKVLLEEWVFLSGFDRGKPCSEAVFKWRPVGGHSRGTWSGWTKTGVTRELEVPDAK